MSFRKIEDDVRELLEDNVAARGDDMVLYAEYAYSKVKNLRYGDGWLQMVFSDRRFRIIHGIAPFDTVSRVRRKLQETEEELRPSEEEIAERKRQIKKYKAYARTGGGSK